MERPTGRVRLWCNGLLIAERSNLVVNAGLPAFAETISGGTTYKVAAVGFGSGNAAPTVNDTDLTGPQKYYNAVGAATYPSSGTVQFAFQIQASDYAAYGMTIQEIGLFANTAAVQLPATAGFSYPAWAASSAQAVGNLVKDSSGHPFRSTVPASWVASTAVVADQLITDSNGNIQQAQGAFTTGSSQPTWPTTVGGTVSDNGGTWKCVALSAYTPTTGSATPSWNISAIGNFTWDNTVAWKYLAGLVIPSPMIAHAAVPAFSFSGSADYAGTWSLAF